MILTSSPIHIVLSAVSHQNILTKSQNFTGVTARNDDFSKDLITLTGIIKTSRTVTRECLGVNGA